MTWQEDVLSDGYEVNISEPIMVDAPEGPRDITWFYEGTRHYRYWLALRSGTTEWNARTFVPAEKLVTLEPGKAYKPEEICSWLPGKAPAKVQFIVERLG